MFEAGSEAGSGSEAEEADSASAGAQTVTVHFPPAGGGPAPSKDTAVDTSSAAAEVGEARDGGWKRRRGVLIGGTAALVVAVAVVIVATTDGSSSGTASPGRQGSQIGEAGAVSNGARIGGSLATDQPGGGAAAGGTPGVPSSVAPAGGQSGPVGSSQGSPGGSSGGPTGSAQPSTPGRPPASGAPTGAPPSTGVKQSPPVAAPKPPAYVGRLAAGTAKASSASTSVTVRTAGASSDGNTLILSVMLTNTHTGTVGASDTAGNSYSVVADQSDGSGDRTLILAAPGARSLGAGGSLTLTFPAALESNIALDDFAGVTKIGAHSTATAASGSFASGSVANTAPGLLFGAAGVQGGATATWSAGFTALPAVTVAPSDQLVTAYESVGAGSHQASGSCDHQWMAAAVALG